MNIYFNVVEVQIQALEYIPKLGRDTRHTYFVRKICLIQMQDTLLRHAWLCDAAMISSSFSPFDFSICPTMIAWDRRYALTPWSLWTTVTTRTNNNLHFDETFILLWTVVIFFKVLRVAPLYKAGCDWLLLLNSSQLEYQSNLSPPFHVLFLQ
jgi:hypothetical protein